MESDKLAVTYEGVEYEVFKEENICGKDFYIAGPGMRNGVSEYVAGTIDRRLEVAGRLLYSINVLADNYAEIADWFYGKIHEETQNVIKQTKADSHIILTANDCHSIYDYDSLKGKLVVVKADTLYKEYQSSEYQLHIAKGGFGCNLNGSGNAIYAENVYTGQEYRIEKYDVIGVIKEECLPEWAREIIRNKENETKNRSSHQKEESR